MPTHKQHSNPGWTAVAAVVLCAGVAAIAPGQPTAASTAPTGQTVGFPTSWTEPDGTQRLVVARVAAEEEAQPVLELVTLPPGGSAVTTALIDERPGEDLVPAPIVAASADGAITVVWAPEDCVATTCTRTFTTYGTEGQILTQHQRAEVGPPVVPLPDGSILTAEPVADGMVRRAADGTVVDTPAADPAEVTSASVDDEGRLVLTTETGHVQRWAGGTEPELDLATACTAAGALRAGPGTNGGFATVCNLGGEAGIRVIAHQEDGSTIWQTAGLPIPAAVSFAATVLTTDAAGTIWVGGSGPLAHDPDASPVWDTTLLARATPTGLSYGGYQRLLLAPGAVDLQGSGIVELRPRAHGVSLVDSQRCCYRLIGQTPEDAVRATTAPKPLAAAPPAPDLVLATSTNPAQAVVTSPPWNGPETFAASYRVTATGPAGTSTTEVPAAARWASTDVAIAGTGGDLVVVEAAARGLDGQLGAATRADTVLPAPSVEAFAADLLARVDPGARPADQVVASSGIRQGWYTPVGLTAHLLRTGHAASVVLPTLALYQGAFDRAPDRSGLSYWVQRRTTGLTLRQAGAFFAASAEFSAKYGALGNRAFVAQLYRNTLGREADAGGLAHWTQKLDGRLETRGGLLAAFTSTGEFRQRHAAKQEPLAAFFVLNRRLPTATEAAAWASPQTPDRWEAIADAFLASDEYRTRLLDGDPTT